MRTVLVLLLLGLAPAGVQADIYRCSEGGTVRYSDTPCGGDAETVTIQDNRIGGAFDSNLPESRPQPQTSEPDEATSSAERHDDSPCRFIPSTDLRRYIIREQVVRGMTRENVIDAFGRTPETYPTPQETWVYTTDYYGRLYELTYVYFKDGCVDKVVYRKP
ncbi:DUF4124 domain-containing protein [Marinobacter bohaiensis]|uniref:DUF4124 domain-containing protein n=1 Tax=Marinobacter bohaiensis TaxID=2201898 RepID=UPI000DAF14C5|nr:DUF4124 domain-containing protein [Marinobacter bohaiensis]